MMARTATRSYARAAESGNVLFLILIAVVLFAALTFAVTMSSRSGDNAGDDKVQLAASQITQSGVDLEAAFMRLRISRNIDPSNISFETDRLTAYANPGCPAGQKECRVFSPEGGQISYNIPNPEWLNRALVGQPYYGDWLYTGTACVPGMGMGLDASCAGNADQLDLIAILPWLTRDICVELNKKLNIPQSNETPPQLSGPGWGASPQYIGTFANGVALIDTGNVLFGHPEGCFEGAGTPPAGSYHYYRVLIQR